jgi:hypothetical protein
MENQATTRSPTDFLSTVLGQTVKVKLNSGIDYKGKLYLNRMFFFHIQTNIYFEI